jgi:CRP/FNR family transcriptional regulator, dissimilatory nitrate respiration regulator
MAVSDWIPAAIRALGVERRLKAGQALFRLGNRTAGLYEIVQGKVRLARVDASGREAILHVAAAGDTIAEASLFSPTYHCDAIAMGDARVRLYPKTALLAELARDPKAAQAFMAMLARQVIRLRTRLEQRNIHSARDRIRHYLAINVGADGKTIALSGTIKELAGELGLTHETLYRTLSVMAAEGEIQRRKGKIKLANPPI